MREFDIWSVCIWSEIQNSTQACIITQIHKLGVAIVIWKYWYFHRHKRHIWTTLWHLMKGKRRLDIINKQNINPSQEFTLFVFDDDVKYFENMAILRFDLGNSLPRSQVRTVVKVIHETNQPTYSHSFYFVQIGPWFMIWPWNYKVKVSAEFKEYDSLI